MVLITLTACGFNPSGSGTSGDDGGGGDDGPLAIDAAEDDGAAIDAPAPIDAATIDAPTPIDAPAIDAAPPIDAATIDARPSCPVGYNVTFNGSLYAFRQIAAMYSVARADCGDDLAGRTHLATFEIAADLDPAVAAVNPGNNAQPFVGAVCADSTADCTQMASWTWATGGAVDATLWATGQPNNGLTQKITDVERGMGPGGNWQLNNTEATQTRPYICECDP